MTSEDPGRGLRGLTVQGWVGAILGLMALTVVGFGVLGASLLSHSSDVTRKLVDESAPARTAIGRFQSGVLDQETGIRGYQISHDPQFLQPYTSGIAAEKLQADRIRGYAADEPTLLGDLAAVRTAVAQWRQSYAEPIIAGHTPSSAQVDTAKREFDHIRALFAVQSRHSDEVRAKDRDELHRTEARRDWAFAAMLATFCLTGVALTILLHRTVGRPLDRLRMASRRVAAGNFEHRLPATGPADIRELARDMEAMRERIAGALVAAEQQSKLLASRTADLDAQAGELRRSNSELEQFAYVASHDLQEPLRKVASFCQLIEKRYGDKLDERGVQYIEFAVDGAKRMQVLINDLLAFSRVGRLNDAHETVDLGRSLTLAMTNLTASFEESGATVSRPGELPAVTGDPTLLSMLWQNLIGNAIKFRAPGRVPHITVEVAPGGGEWEFCVTDNGIGIPPEFADKVFVIFQRLHSRDAYGGTGIGLAMCKKIVEYHGGRIWIDTEHTGGARIRFTLPAVATGPDGAAEVPALEGTSA
ncbi:MAG: histidine kinase [Actinomycetia bacterium]|jgi:signal transduction histidine kinase|nr:histidine kinase [Actinomycetes bacterium]MDQ1657417.1 hypothetical protein [Cryptosporangiaceae bacterium]